MARLEADAAAPRGALRRARRRPPRIRSLGAAAAGRRPDARGAGRRRRGRDEARRLRPGPHRRQLVRRLDSPGARASRPVAHRHGDLARGLQHGREKEWGAGVLRTLRWVAQSAPVTEPLVRNPVARTLLMSSLYARARKKEPEAVLEETELFAHCPGFDATLPPTFEAQPRGLPTLDTPVLILWGTFDVVLMPRQGRRFERLIPGAELRYIWGLGHVPMSDAPAELAGAIEEFALERPRARPVAQAAARS